MTLLRFKQLVGRIACNSLLHTMYIVSARLFVTDYIVSKGTVKNEQIQVLCVIVMIPQDLSYSSQYHLMYCRFPFSRQINANIKYVHVLGSAKALNQRIINIIRMYSNSIKSGLRLYCGAWYTNSPSIVRDEHVVHC